MGGGTAWARINKRRRKNVNRKGKRKPRYTPWARRRSFRMFKGGKERKEAELLGGDGDNPMFGARTLWGKASKANEEKGGKFTVFIGGRGWGEKEKTSGGEP